MTVKPITNPREVQCQRTRLYLPWAVAVGETVDCPWCEERETYERLGPTSDHALVLAGAIAMCRDEFAVGDDGIETAVWLGDGPETVHEPHAGRINVYLGRRSGPLQVRYSGAHEAFHRVCSPCTGQQWADEMFAVLFSLLYLDRMGYEEHANLNRETDLLPEAAECTAEEMFARDGPCPPGLYGRVFVLGTALEEQIGWDRLKTLATTKRADGRMDVAAWLDGLTEDERSRAAPLLQGAPEL